MQQSFSASTSALERVAISNEVVMMLELAVRTKSEHRAIVTRSDCVMHLVEHELHASVGDL